MRFVGSNHLGANEDRRNSGVRLLLFVQVPSGEVTLRTSPTKAAKEVHGLWEILFTFPAVKIGQRLPGEAGMKSEEKSWEEAADLLSST